MQCQQCQAREATVHFSAVAWPSGEDTKHLCDTCYREVEARHTASYNPKRKPLPTVDVEHITALEYLDFAARSHANSADIPAYRYVSEELNRFPATRERLATEMLTMALESLEVGNDSWNLIGFGICFSNTVPGMKTSAFVQLLEKIVLLSVELMAQSSNSPSHHPFGMGLSMAANGMRRDAPAHFSNLLQSLKAQYRERVQGRAVLDYLEKRMAESERRCGGKEGGGE